MPRGVPKTKQTEEITDEQLIVAQAELQVVVQVLAVLRDIPDPRKRLRVLRSACIVTTGKDLDEL